MTTSTTPALEPVVDAYSAEFGDGVNGFEEKFIAEAFGKSLDTLGAEGDLMAIRALVFVHRLREGDKNRAAKDYALNLTRREVAAYFLGLGERPDGEAGDEGKGR
jgi:hypothetical protein